MQEKKKNEVEFSLPLLRSRSLLSINNTLNNIMGKENIDFKFVFVSSFIHFVRLFVLISLAFQNYISVEPPDKLLENRQQCFGQFRIFQSVFTINTTAKKKNNHNLAHQWCWWSITILILVGHPYCVHFRNDWNKSIFSFETNCKSIETILSSTTLKWLI